MLVKRAILDRIVAGEIDLLFRKWKRPTVKSGGSLRTAVGMLAIVSIQPISTSRISVSDAHRAGYSSRTKLLEDLETRTTGTIYRIEVRFGGEDPRIATRENSDPTSAELDDLRIRTSRLDAVNPRGEWTVRTLRLVEANPRVRAQDLADIDGVEKQTFKANVRKLKALGLTISHSPGYEISPLGRAFLSSLDD